MAAFHPLRLFVLAVAEERVELFRFHPPDHFCDAVINVPVVWIKSAGSRFAPGTLDKKLNLGSAARLAVVGL
jgi:hypothetical protein